MLLTLIAIILITTFGQAFNSQCNKEDIFRYDSRGKQRVKEMLHSDQGNFFMNPLKSETNNSSALERLSLPIPHDDPASFMSIVLSQLTVVPTLSFSHFHTPANAVAMQYSSVMWMHSLRENLFVYFNIVRSQSKSKSSLLLLLLLSKEPIATGALEFPGPV